MKYEVIRACMYKAEPYKPGDILELDDKDARELMAIGRIQPAADKPATENRAVGLEGSAEKPKRRGRPKKKVEEEPVDDEFANLPDMSADDSEL